MSSLVSIIIPCFNAAETIDRALRACLSQSYGHLEIILVDNNCTDATVTKAENTLSGCGYPWQVIPCTKQGVNHARNTGFRASHGQYVQWLDSDDQMSSNKIAKQVHALESSDAADIAYCDWDWCFHLNPAAADQQFSELTRMVLGAVYGERRWTRHGPGGQLAVQHFKLNQYDDYLLRLLEDKWVPPVAYLMRRSIAEALAAHGLWDPTIRLATDRQYFSSAALLGAEFRYVGGVLAVYNAWSSGQTTLGARDTERAASLAKIFQKLRSLSVGARLTRDHLFLLAQNFRQYVNVPQGEVQLEDLSTDSQLSVATCAEIERILSRYSQPATLERHAKIIASSSPRLWGQHLSIMRYLDRLQRAGRLVPADNEESIPQ